MALIHALLAGAFVLTIVSFGFYGLLTESKKRQLAKGEDVSDYRWWIGLASLSFNLSGLIFIISFVITVAMLAYR